MFDLSPRLQPTLSQGRCRMVGDRQLRPSFNLTMPRLTSCWGTFLKLENIHDLAFNRKGLAVPAALQPPTSKDVFLGLYVKVPGIQTCFLTATAAWCWARLRALKKEKQKENGWMCEPSRWASFIPVLKKLTMQFKVRELESGDYLSYLR